MKRGPGQGVGAGCRRLPCTGYSDAVRIVVEKNKVVAEGAGAAPVAAALAGKGGTGKVVCVISSGNLDTSHLLDILEGRVPQA